MNNQNFLALLLSIALSSDAAASVSSKLGNLETEEQEKLFHQFDKCVNECQNRFFSKPEKSQLSMNDLAVKDACGAFVNLRYWLQKIPRGSEISQNAQQSLVLLLVVPLGTFQQGEGCIDKFKKSPPRFLSAFDEINSAFTRWIEPKVILKSSEDLAENMKVFMDRRMADDPLKLTCKGQYPTDFDRTSLLFELWYVLKKQTVGGCENKICPIVLSMYELTRVPSFGSREKDLESSPICVSVIQFATVLSNTKCQADQAGIDKIVGLARETLAFVKPLPHEPDWDTWLDKTLKEIKVSLNVIRNNQGKCKVEDEKYIECVRGELAIILHSQGETNQASKLLESVLSRLSSTDWTEEEKNRLTKLIGSIHAGVHYFYYEPDSNRKAAAQRLMKASLFLLSDFLFGETFAQTNCRIAEKFFEKNTDEEVENIDLTNLDLSKEHNTEDLDDASSSQQEMLSFGGIYRSSGDSEFYPPSDSSTSFNDPEMGAIYPDNDELKPDGNPLKVGTIHASNSFTANDQYPLNFGTIYSTSDSGNVQFNRGSLNSPNMHEIYPSRPARSSEDPVDREILSKELKGSAISVCPSVFLVLEFVPKSAGLLFKLVTATSASKMKQVGAMANRALLKKLMQTSTESIPNFVEYIKFVINYVESHRFEKPESSKPHDTPNRQIVPPQ